MNKQQVMSQATLVGNDCCKVIYQRRKDMVILEIGGISLKLDAGNFMMMNEAMRKAAARLAMQTQLKY